MVRQRPRSSRLPYTTLFRSQGWQARSARKATHSTSEAGKSKAKHLLVRRGHNTGWLKVGRHGLHVKRHTARVKRGNRKRSTFLSSIATSLQASRLAGTVCTKGDTQLL